MDKSIICLVIYSLVLISLMITFSYLIVKIHPEPHEKVNVKQYQSRLRMKEGSCDEGECNKTTPEGSIRLQTTPSADYSEQEEEQEDPSLLDTTPALLHRGKNVVTKEQNFQEIVLNNITLSNRRFVGSNRRSAKIRRYGDSDSKNIIFKVVDEDGSPKFEIKINNIVKKKKLQKKRYPMIGKTVDENKYSEEVSDVIVLKMLSDNKVMIDNSKTPDAPRKTAQKYDDLDNKSREKVINVIGAMLGNNITFVSPKFVTDKSNIYLKETDTAIDKLLQRNTTEVTINVTEVFPPPFKKTVSLFTDITNNDVVT